MQLIVQLQKEIEALCIRGIRAITSEQLNWLRNSRDRLRELGAEFLAEKISRLLSSIDSDEKNAPSRLLDLLTTVRVFERTLTLKITADKLSTFLAEAKA
jgi:hypothetical protein